MDAWARGRKVYLASRYNRRSCQPRESDFSDRPCSSSSSLWRRPWGLTVLASPAVALRSVAPCSNWKWKRNIIFITSESFHHYYYYYYHHHLCNNSLELLLFETRDLATTSAVCVLSEWHVCLHVPEIHSWLEFTLVLI